MYSYMPYAFEIPFCGHPTPCKTKKLRIAPLTKDVRSKLPEPYRRTIGSRGSGDTAVDVEEKDFYRFL